jgi:hypothetical protein
LSKGLDSNRNIFSVLLWLQQGGFIGGRLEYIEHLYIKSVRSVLQQKAFSVKKNWVKIFNFLGEN